MSRIASLGPPRTHPHPPAPSRPVLQPSGAAPILGGLRLLAARLLAEQAERCGRADARLERLLAAGLRAAGVRGVARAGWARAGAPAQAPWPRAEDLARALGLEGADVRALVRFDRALAALPRIAAAYDAGDLSRAKLLALLPSVGPDTEELWLGRAARHEAAALGAMSAGAAAGDAPPAPGTRPASRPGSAAADLPQRPVSEDAAPRVRSQGDEFPIWMDAAAAVREALRPLGPGTEPATLIEGRIDEPPGGPEPSATLFETHDTPDQAHVLARLRHLVALRQSVEWRIGRLLAALERHALHVDLGFASLEAWAADVPGLPADRVAALLAIDGSLAPLPATADAWRRGRITWRQAILVARVATPRTEREWLRRALHVAPERLEALVGAVRPSSTGMPHDGGATCQPPAVGRGITRGAPVAGSRRTSTSVS